MLLAEDVRKVLDYDPFSGVLVWKWRDDPALLFWNKRYAGAEAGCVNPEGYRQVGLNGRDYGSHNLAWLIVHGEWPLPRLDHENLVRNDNRLSNLRLATVSQNNSNKGLRIDNSLGLKGAYRHGNAGRWYSLIKARGEQYYLGVFDTKEDAHNAYCAAATRLHGEFANFG